MEKITKSQSHLLFEFESQMLHSNREISGTLEIRRGG